jgi:uncharacterized lipoprotein YajG
MKIKLFDAMLMMTLLTGACMAQPNSLHDQSKEAAKWGNAVEGVQLSVSLTNNIVAVGSTMALSARIKNSSTNPISVYVKDPRSDFEVYITNKSGKVFKISPDPDTNSPVYAIFAPIFINAGESHEWIIPETIGKDVASGDYTLKVTKRVGKNGSFGKNGNYFDLVSNSLDVQIK